jgi:hypothetical protein
MLQRIESIVTLLAVTAVVTLFILAIALKVMLEPFAIVLVSLIGGVITVGFITLIYRVVPILRSSVVSGALDVTFVGFPKSGKTTFIVSMFRESFRGKTLYKLDPRGSLTIDRLNQHIDSLDRGLAIKSTEEEEQFGFRADITVPRHGIPLTYRVQFGDFSGQHSKQFSGSTPWLHNEEYFKYVIDSDILIFVVDIGQWLKDGDGYVRQMSTAFRAAWQHFLDANVDRIPRVKQKPFILFFAKSDLLTLRKEISEKYLLTQRVDELGFGRLVPNVHEINVATTDELQVLIEDDFTDIIQYFRSECKSFHMIFGSSFATANGTLLGVNDLLKAVLSSS